MNKDVRTFKAVKGWKMALGGGVVALLYDTKGQYRRTRRHVELTGIVVNIEYGRGHVPCRIETASCVYVAERQ